MKSSRKPIQRARRYSVSENYTVRVTLKHYDEHDRPLVTEAQLLDLSPGGAKLSLSAPFPFEDDLIVSLESEELNLRLSLSARICWLRQQNSTCWILGCGFDPQLPDQELERLFAYGMLERREVPRQSVRGQAVARWELQPGETPVGLLDLSEGGFSILSPASSEVGRRLQLSFDCAGQSLCDTSATVRWQLEVEGGWVIGCELGNPNSYSALSHCLCPKIADPPAPHRRRLLPVVSAGTVMALLYWCWQALAR